MQRQRGRANGEKRAVPRGGVRGARGRRGLRVERLQLGGHDRTTAEATVASEGLKPRHDSEVRDSPSSSEPVQSGVVQIAYRNIAIDPDTVRAKVGSHRQVDELRPGEAQRDERGRPVLRSPPKDFGEGGTRSN